MIDPLSPSTISPPPSPSSNFPNSNNIAMLYYGVVVVGTGAILLTLYNLIIIKRRRDMQLRAAAGRNRRVDQFVATSRIYENSSCNLLLSSFKYNKKEEEEGVDNECAVCLSVFEEGEEVRKLPRCNHSFHALCIDMWLYSHENCPICRTAVGPPCRQLPAENSNAPAENSREGLLDSGMSV